jgi:hypothetical protein
MLLATLLTMKPLHKPVRDVFIFDSTWRKMSIEEREKAIAEGKIRIPSREEFRNLKAADLNEMRAKVRPIFEEIRENIVLTLKALPRTLILIFRCLLSPPPILARYFRAEFQCFNLIKKKINLDFYLFCWKIM